MELRSTLHFSLGGPLSVVHEFIHASMRRSAVDRLLRRRSVSCLPVEITPMQKLALAL